MNADAGRAAILMYHSFAEPCGSLRHLTVPAPLLDDQLAALREAGFRFVPVRDVPEALRSARAQDRIVAISIDDGLADGLEAAAIIAARGATATYFVPTAFVGRTALWLEDAYSRRPMLGWSDLADLLRAGMELGSHGHAHVAADVNRADVVRVDAERSRSAFEDALGITVTSYAYPFGYQRRVARRAVAAAGYACACAIFGLTACRNDDVYALPRLEVGPDTSPELLVTLCLRQWRALGRLASHQRQRLWSAGRRIMPLGPPSARRIAPGEPPAPAATGPCQVDQVS